MAAGIQERLAAAETTQTRGAIREPNFFIVGAARSGTTSLWHSLRQHPDVFMPLQQQQPHFFCDASPPWAVKHLDAYLALFADAQERKASGEATTGYLGSPDFQPTTERQNPSAFPLWVRGHYQLTQWWKHRQARRQGQPGDRVDDCCAIAWHVNLYLGTSLPRASLFASTRARLGKRYADDVR